MQASQEIHKTTNIVSEAKREGRGGRKGAEEWETHEKGGDVIVDN